MRVRFCTMLCLAALAVGCGGKGNPLSPSASLPTPVGPVLNETSYEQESETTPVVVESTPVNPFTKSSYAWTNKSYEAVVTITNGSDVALNYLLAVYETDKPGNPKFLERQKLISVVGVSVDAHSSRTVTGKIYNGCNAYFQADVYTNLTADDVQSGRVNIHPAATPKVYEVTFKFGKSADRSDCPKPPPPPPPPCSGAQCKPPTPPTPPPTCETNPELCPPPPPPPPPPGCEVTQTCPPPPPDVEFCHVPPGNPENAQTMWLPLTAIYAGHIPNHEGDHFGACEVPPPPPPPPPTCETDPTLCPPPPPPPPPPGPVCEGPFSYEGPTQFDIVNSSDALELAYVQNNVSNLLVGPTKITLAATSWTSTGNYAVVLMKGPQHAYKIFLNVTTGQVLQSPWFNQNNKQQNISHVSLFSCPLLVQN